MTAAQTHLATAKRDSAHRRVRGVTVGLAAVVVGATSYGAVALAQSAVDNSAITPASHQGTPGGNLSSGTGQAPVAGSGAS